MPLDDLDLEPLPPELKADTPLDSQVMSNAFQEFIFQKSRGSRNVRRDALHEAGHCIGAWRCGFQVERIDIRRSSTGENGQSACVASFSVMAKRFGTAYPKTHFELAVVSVSGIVAERLVFQDDIDIFNEFRWANDIREAKFHLENSKKFSNKKEAEFPLVLKEAEGILRENWASVERLAMGSMKGRRVLSNKTIIKLIEGKDEILISK
ncbi:MAG TPA: hypothetical protein PKW95_24100 [bacterium]|nr:hypothetical protein [bacterium]